MGVAHEHWQGEGRQYAYEHFVRTVDEVTETDLEHLDVPLRLRMGMRNIG